MATDTKVAGYSPAQMALHWIVVVLVAFQFLAHDGIEDAWRAFLRAEPLSEGEPILAYMHIVAGIAILVLALIRIYLRFTRGTPAPPEDEPKFLQLTAEAVHWSIYLLLLLLPLSGSLAWFVDLEPAGDAHELLQKLLLAAIALHVAGALFQHFILRSQVLMRMLRPQSR